MTRIKRITRLIRHFRRIRDEKAGELAGVETRMIELIRTIAAIRSRRDDVNEYLSVRVGHEMDVQSMIMAGVYKTRLKSEIETCLDRMASVETEAVKMRRETAEAHRTQKIWENVKEKLETTEKENAGQSAQRQLDESAQQKQHHFRTYPVSGINSRT